MRMAANAKKSDSRKSEARQTPELQRRAIIAAFEQEIAQKGWFGTHPASLAEKAGMTLAQVHALFPRKLDLLSGLAKAIDEDVLAEGPAEADEPARDRLFEVMMRRMDALQDRRETIERLMTDLPRDPAAAFHRLLTVPGSMAWMLQAALIDTGGLEGALKVRALAVIYGLVLPVWRKDKSDDLSATMKALDERLRIAEEMANSFLPSARGPASGQAGADEKKNGADD